MSWKKASLLGSLCVGLCMLFGSALAQSNEVTLTIAIEEMRSEMLSERVLQGFYDTHPGVKIVPVVMTAEEQLYHAFGLYNPDEILDRAESVFSKGDVVMVREDYNLAPFITRAGYVLDLTPYLRAEGSGAVDDFYPVASQMFRWDNGAWGLPAALMAHVMVYNADAFDAAGYPTPDSSWTIDQYLDAADALSIRDTNGRITQPGFMNFYDSMILRLMLGHGFYDASGEVEIPSFDDPDFEAHYMKLNSYLQELADSNPDGTAPWDRNTVPLQISGAWNIGIEGATAFYRPVLLPDAPAFVSGQGFAVSAGTQYPDLAYELAMYLTSDPEVVVGFYMDAPARRSLADQPDIALPASELFTDILPEILENGLAWSEMRYGEYLDLATYKVREEAVPVDEALQAAEEAALDNLQLAEARREKPVVVSTPVPTPQLAAGKIAIKFLIQTPYSTITNREQWEQIEQEFVAVDPEVSNVQVTLGIHDPRTDILTADCAYFPRNIIPLLDLSVLQPLDAFLATDPTFDRSDIPAALWPQVTVNDQIYALPVTLTPLMMWYNPKDFKAVGIDVPENSWMISDFLDAVAHLNEISPDHKVYRSQTPGGDGYGMLAAALGGLAIDYSTPNPTYHLTDPAVIEALRQLLDLARQGDIEYLPLEELGTSQILIDDRGFPPSLYEAPAYINNWDDVGTDFNPHLPVTFPQGADIIPLSFDLGAAYVTADTPYADACYRWLSTIAQHPELFTEMPARRSLATSDPVIAAHGQRASDFYVGQFALLDNPKAVIFPSFSNMRPAAHSIMQIWFQRALDAYVLENADLAQGLADAQTKIDEYTTCIAGLPDLGYSVKQSDELTAYYQKIASCAVDIDPTMREEVAPLLG
jgi:ABC-type glycerol-3-phosphate transport system substrate-binding protein